MVHMEIDESRRYQAPLQVDHQPINPRRQLLWSKIGDLSLIRSDDRQWIGHACGVDDSPVVQCQRHLRAAATP